MTIRMYLVATLQIIPEFPRKRLINSLLYNN